MRVMFTKLLQNLRKGKKTFIVNMIFIAVTFSSISAVVVLLYNLGSVIQKARRNLVLTIYLKPDVKMKDVDKLMEAINSFPEVAGSRFVSCEDFKRRFLKNFTETGSGVAEVEKDGFPSIVEVSLTSGSLSKGRNSMIVEKVKKLPYVEGVSYRENFLRKFNSLLDVVWIGFSLLGILIFISSMLVLSNSIQLSFMKRSKAVEIMRLCGATNLFIEAPVLMEGFIIGFVGSGIGVIITQLCIKFLNMRMHSFFGYATPFEIGCFPVFVALILVVLGGLAGMGGAHLASRKVLRV